MNDLVIIGTLEAIHHNQSMSIGLFEQVFGLVDFVSGIDCYENRTDFSSCPEGDIPSRNIGCPDRNVISLADTHCNEGSCKGIHIIAKFGIGAGIIQLGIAERILSREFFTDSIQHIGEGIGNQTLFRPDILTGTSVVGLQTMLMLMTLFCHIIVFLIKS